MQAVQMASTARPQTPLLAQVYAKYNTSLICFCAIICFAVRMTFSGRLISCMCSYGRLILHQDWLHGQCWGLYLRGWLLWLGDVQLHPVANFGLLGYVMLNRVNLSVSLPSPFCACVFASIYHESPSMSACGAFRVPARKIFRRRGRLILGHVPAVPLWNILNHRRGSLRKRLHQM